MMGVAIFFDYIALLAKAQPRPDPAQEFPSIEDGGKRPSRIRSRTVTIAIVNTFIGIVAGLALGIGYLELSAEQVVHCLLASQVAGLVALVLLRWAARVRPERT